MKKTLLVTLIFLSTGLMAQNEDRPNVIFILADDLGAGDLHSTGHPYALTPNLDKLADQGIRFERAYMAAAWCAPSRYGLMSGQFPARNFDQTRNLKPDEPSVTLILNNAGYNTAHIGKWHMTQGTEFSDSPDDFGIDTHFLSNYKGGDNINTWTREERNAEFWRASTTDAYVDMTIDFIKANRSSESQKPFYVNLWIYPTHSYIHPTPEQLKVYDGLKVDYNDFSPYQQEFLRFVAKYGDIDKAMQAYCADITAMDKALGRLFTYLKESKIDKNTIIVFSSDNGPGPLTPQVISESVVKRYDERPDLLNSVGSAKIYKERKISLHDGGIRVPFIVSWPGKVPNGKVDDRSVIQGVDWLPTVASICNIELPEGVYDGVDATSAFLGQEFQRDKAVYWTQAGSTAVLVDNWKGILWKDDRFALYDIEKDPIEQEDLTNEFPEIASKIENDVRSWKKTIALP